MMKSCLILGGGEITDYAAVKAQIGRINFILCADSGFLHCEKLGITPNLLVGDFDSIGKIPENIERMTYPANKNYTDSTLAIKTAVERGFSKLLLAGMLGGRFDHSVANLQNLAWCAANGITAKITDGKTEIFAIKDGKLIVEPRKDTYFSVISLVTQCKNVNIVGAKYPLSNYDLRSDDPRAISNEFAESDAEISVESGIIAVIVVPK